MQLDHTIVRISQPSVSVPFYRDVLGLQDLGQMGPFHVLRVSPSLTLDLLPQPPQDSVHLAFSVDQATFDGVLQRLRAQGIAYGSDTFERDGATGPNAFGARGMAESVYFYDPDGHNLELRVYPNAG